MAKRPAKPARKPAKANRAAKPARPKRAAAKTTATFVWRHLKLRVTHTPDYINPGWSHIELHVLAPKGAPCPVTMTGYLSHFLDAGELAAANGPVVFFTAWLDREAKSKEWAKVEFRWRQGDLFAER